MITTDLPLRNYIGASGGTISGTATVDANTLWEVSLQSGKQDSAFTFCINGESGVTYYSGDTAGDYAFEVSVPAWDGSGDVNQKGRRLATYAFTQGGGPTLAFYQEPPKHLFLGGEVDGLYIQGSAVTAVYMGEDPVYPNGIYKGLIVSPMNIKFNSGSLTNSLRIKSSESWTLTTPEWISASSLTGGTGETFVTLSATTQSAATSGTLQVVTTSYSGRSIATYSAWDELEYIQNGANDGNRGTDFCIDLNYVPTTSTKVEITLEAAGADGASILCTDYTGNADWWRFFTYSSSHYYFDCPNDSDARVEVNFDVTGKTTAIVWIEGGSAWLQISGDTAQEQTLPTTPNISGHLKLWTINYNGSDLECLYGTKIYGIKIYEGQTLARDLRPGQIGNDVGLSDVVGGVLYQNSGSGTLLYA